MDLRITGKRALVMGGSSGIGKAIARSLVSEGVKVAICARDEVKLNAAAKELKVDLAISCDLTIPGEAKKLVRKVFDEFGGLDILVTNTGGPAQGSIEDITREQWMVGFQGLWMSAVEAIQTALPGMKANQWGRIILITSVAAKEALPHLTISNSLRAGLLGLTKTISNEIASYGITINSVLPGYTRTERLQELGIPESKMTAQIPAGRLADPNELGALACFLASNQSGYITGQAIVCDGGYMKGI